MKENKVGRTSVAKLSILHATLLLRELENMQNQDRMPSNKELCRYSETKCYPLNFTINIVICLPVGLRKPITFSKYVKNNANNL